MTADTLAAERTRIASRDQKLEALLAELQKVDKVFDYNVPQLVHDTYDDDDLLKHLDHVYRQPFFPITQPEAVTKYADIGVRARAKDDIVFYDHSEEKFTFVDFNYDNKTATVLNKTSGNTYERVPFSELYIKGWFFGDFTSDKPLDQLQITHNGDALVGSVTESDPTKYKSGSRVWLLNNKVRTLSVTKGSLGLIAADYETCAQVVWDAGSNVIAHSVRGDHLGVARARPELVVADYEKVMLELRNEVPYEKLLQSTGVRVLG